MKVYQGICKNNNKKVKQKFLKIFQGECCGKIHQQNFGKFLQKKYRKSNWNPVKTTRIVKENIADFWSNLLRQKAFFRQRSELEGNRLSNHLTKSRKNCFDNFWGIISG